MGIPGTSAGGESTCHVGDLGSIPVLGRDPLEKGKYSAWGIPWPVVSLGAKSWTQLSDFQFTSGQTERTEVEKNYRHDERESVSCSVVSNNMECSLLGSSVHGILRQECWSG